MNMSKFFLFFICVILLCFTLGNSIIIISRKQNIKLKDNSNKEVVEANLLREMYHQGFIEQVKYNDASDIFSVMNLKKLEHAL